MTKKKKLTKKQIAKVIKGTRSPGHATKVLPNKKKNNTISFDNADMGIGE